MASIMTQDTALPERASGNKAPLFALFLVVFISLVGFGIVIPVFPFFGQMVGASAEQITLAMAAYSLGQFIGAPFWGRMSDQYGRRPILICSLLASVAAYVIMAHATDIWTLGISRLVGGLMAGNIAAAFAYIGDITTDEDRPQAMGLLGAAFGMGFIFGPAIGGLIAGGNSDPNDFLYIGYASAAFTFIAALCTFVLVKESLSPERRAAADVNRKPGAFAAATLVKAKPIVFWLAIVSLLVTGAGALFEATFAFLAMDRFVWGPREIGLSFALIGAVAAVTQGLFVSPAVKMFGEARVMNGSLILYAIGLAGLGYVTSEILVLACLVLTAFGVGLFSSSYQSYTSAQSNDYDRGLIMGLTQSAGSLGRVFGPAAAGVMYVGLGQSAPFLWGGILMIVSFGVGVFTVRRYGKRGPAARVPAGH